MPAPSTITNLSGLIAGVLLTVGNVYPKYKTITDSLSGLALAVLGYFANKKAV